MAAAAVNWKGHSAEKIRKIASALGTSRRTQRWKYIIWCPHRGRFWST